MLKADGKCPYCGLPLGNILNETEKYDWIIRSCVRCGQKYADDRYCEPVLYRQTPKVMKEWDMSGGITLFLFGMLFVVGSIGAGFMLGDPFGLLQLTMFAGIICLLGIFLMLRALMPRTREKYEIRYGESLLRLQNKQYVQDLIDAGYEVPEDVLDDLRYVKNV